MSERGCRRSVIGTILATGLLVAIGIASEMKGEEPGRKTFTMEDARIYGDPSAIKFPLRRPFDDSDPEMQAVAEAYLQQPGCNRKPGERCPRYREMSRPLIEGGDRLATYLIRQYEESIAGEYHATQTILTMIARTRSAVGTGYVAGRIDQPRGEKEFRYSLTALRECGSNRAVDKALDVLSRTEETDGKTRALAVRALHWNIEEGKFRRPDAIREIRASSNRPTSSGVERAAARRALKSLEE